MAKFTNCLQIVNAMPEQDQDALLARLDELQAQGLSPKEAQLQAAIDVLAQVEREGQVSKNADRVTDTPEFKTWAMGMPVFDSFQDASGYRGVFKLYHATPKDFTEFKPGGENPTDSGPAIWLSSSPASTAAAWRVGTEERGFRDGANIMPVYARLSSPFLIDDKETMKWAREVYGTSEFPQLISQKTIDLLKEDGYDSIIALSEPLNWGANADEIIVFEPTQIKSAVGNNGQFDPANPDIRKSIDRDANFKRWTRGLPVIEADFSGTYDGGPAVFQAYHGTTHTDIQEFKNIGNKEGALGQGPYFSTSVDDVNENYAGVGPDLTSRIGREIDNVAQGFDDDAWYATDVLQAYFNDNGIDTEITDDNIEELKDEHRDKAIEHAATKALKGDSDGFVMPVYVRLEKPFNMATSPTYFEMTYPVDENGEPDYEAEPEGSAVDLINAINEVASGYNADVDGLTSWVYENGADGVSAREVWDRAGKDVSDLYDDNGELISSGQFMQEVARELGFDGLIQDADAYFGTQRRGFGGIRAGAMKGVQPGTLHIMPFDGAQVKSATGNSGEFGENRQILKSVDRPQFYSQLQRTIEGVPDRLASMAAPQWKLWLDSNGPKQGVKKDEIEWSGIKDYLDLQGKKKLSKDELSSYLDDSGVKVGEVVRGEIDQDAVFEQMARDMFDTEHYDLSQSQRREVMQALDRMLTQSNTAYEKYTLPGGENYRELLITLPSNGGQSFDAWLSEKGIDPIEDAEPELRKQWASDNSKKGDKSYRSSHWDELNVLAHIRINDRMAEGDGPYKVTVREGGGRSGSSTKKFDTLEAAQQFIEVKKAGGYRTELENLGKLKVLFVEEVQSDWGQDGLKKGFKATPAQRAKTESRIAELSDQIQAIRDSGVNYPADGTPVSEIDPKFMELQKLIEERVTLQSANLSDGNLPPPAPFVGKTEGWLNLALKRIAMLAVEGGYDKVAFVNGEQSADRYDLSKQISSISYEPGSKPENEGLLQAWDLNRKMVMSEMVTTDRIEDYVGKEVAVRLLETDKVMGKHLLDGEDIKVGGKGMIKFYDEIVPQALNKLLPKIGGDKLGAVNIGSMDTEQGREGDALLAQLGVEVEGKRPPTQPGFDVTDKMRETVKQGLSLFSRDRFVQADKSELYQKRTAKDVGLISEKDAMAALETDATSVRIMEKGYQVKPGELVGARLNLNVLKNTKVPVMTLHKATNTEGYKKNRGFYRGEAVQYKPAVTLRNAYFNVDQTGRENIATGSQNKFPMASVDGEFVNAKPNFDGVEVSFNPMRVHLFVDGKGRPVRSAEEISMFGTRAYARGKIEYYTEETAPIRKGEAESAVKFSRDRAQTRTPEFQRWFGDSKVVDADGSPLVVYTGTSKDVDFKSFKIPKNGAWFTYDPYTASAYALENDSMGVETKDYRTFTNVNTASRVMPVYLRIEKMYTPTYDEMTALIRASNYKREQGNLFDRVRRDGYDGVDMGGGVYVVIGDATQIKSAIGNDGGFDPSKKDITKSVDRPRFYSQLQRAIEQVPARLDNVSAAAWKQWITANAPKLGVKAEEVEWSGIKDFLDLQGKKRLSKDELSAYLGDSGVKVSETVLGDIKDFSAMDDEQLAKEYTRIRGYEPESYGERMSREEMLDELEGMLDEDADDTRYGKYVLPGGQNYRELLLTLPSKWWGQPIGGERREFDNPNAASRYAGPDGQGGVVGGSSAIRFKSTHFDQPNILAHIRVNDRTDADGKRVLFVEEVQSDWGQQGREKGFGKVTRFEYEALQSNGQLVRSFRDKGEAEAFAKARNLELKEIPFTVDTGIPVAPFVTKTEGWLNLALKRIAMMAVEGGYDKVAFVNGAQSSERYDLSKQIDRLEYFPESKSLIAMQGRNNVLAEVGVSESRLADLVGKEVAQRLLEQPTKPTKRIGESGVKLLEGQSLKVGGEGMVAFYDQIVPQSLNKLLPKLGGEKSAPVNFGKAEWVVRNSEEDVLAEGFSFEEDARRYAADYRGATVKNEGGPGEQPGFDVTEKMRETVGAGVPLFSRDRTNTPEFKKWFGNSRMTNSDGSPNVFVHSSQNEFSAFDKSKQGPEKGFFFYAKRERQAKPKEGTQYRVYLKMENPLSVNYGGKYYDQINKQLRADIEQAKADGYDGLIASGIDDAMSNPSDPRATQYIVFEPTQIKSATDNNGEFDGSNPDIRKSTARKPWFEDLSKLKVSTNYQLGDLLKSSKKLSWWDRTVGTQYGLAQKNPEFKRTFDAVQTFINDVSAYATQAADLAPSILPKLDGIRDVLKKPLSAQDVAALRDPIFGGTLKYMRDDDGKIVETDDVKAAGVVFSDEELRSMFNLNDKQIDLYREFRKATDRSLTDLALSDMIRYLGDDGVDIKEAVMATANVDVGAGIIESHLESLAGEAPSRAESIASTIEAIQQKAEQANRLMDRGYAPLSRFGQYTVYVVGENGEQEYFGMFETQRDANKMAREMEAQYPNGTVTTGTMSQESYKLFSGVTPETLALFGESLGLEESGMDPKSEVFQQYLKMAKTNRSAMKRLIERKGIDGFSEDAGRVLAGFVYSNARQVSTNLHAGEIGKSASQIKDGDIKDHAIRLIEYIQNPTEEAQKLKALLFTTFLGGNISSAAVNLTQTATTTFPYLAQFDGTGSVMKRLGDAAKLATRGIRNDDELKQALKRAEDEGVVSPQEVFHLMAQAQGKAQLQTGDGTKVGDALAKANNFMTKATLGWGRLFSAAEQANRRIAFIAAYKLARDKGMESPFQFAEKAVLETQFSTNKGIRPAWARGAVGGVLFTFKGFTIAYLELLGRMLGNGPEGKKAFALALGTLFLFAGAGGLPFVDDLDDLVDGFAQRVLGRSFDSKQAKKEFFASIFGQTGAEFVMGGISSLPGAPIDVSGRLGLGNIVPGTGILPKKANYQRDAMEIFGPAGSLFSNYASAVGMLAQGEVGKAASTAAPLGIQNLIKGMDMAQMGFYRDTRGRKVIDTNGWEAFAKSLGFQPASVKQIQEATSTQQNLIAQNKLRETEIADKMARARIERKPELAQDAREELAEWNRKNPQSPISIDPKQINRRVQQAMMDKAQRLAKTAPKEIRSSVAKELERASD